MMNNITKRISELRTLDTMSMHDKQMSRLPHIERTATVRVPSYILKDKVVLVNTKQELCFSISTVHIKSIQAKRVLYSHDSEEVFPLTELVDKNYVQGFLVFVNGYFIPWKYLNLVCLTEKNYLLVHVDADDSVGMNFIKNNRSNNLKVDVVTIPNSYKYKELDNLISGTLGEDFIMGFKEDFTYSNTNVKYIITCLDNTVEHSYNKYNIIHNTDESVNRTLNSNVTGRFYDEECCFVFNNNRLDTSIDINYVGNILAIKGKGNFSYLSCYNKRNDNCVNHASRINQDNFFSMYTLLNSNNAFKNLIGSKFDAKINRKFSFFKNIQEFSKSVIQYDSKLIMDYICNNSCSIKTFEFTGQQILDARGEDNIFRISKFYDVALDDKIITIKNGTLYGLKSKEYRGEKTNLAVDRWRVISSRDNNNASYDEWLAANANNSIDPYYQDNWLSSSGTGEVNEAVTDEWLHGENSREIPLDYDMVGVNTTPDDEESEFWYSMNEGEEFPEGSNSENENWFEVENTIPTVFLELDTFDRDVKNSHIFNVPVIEIEPEDTVEFLIFQHANNLLHDTIFHEDDDFDYLSEDVYNLSTNIFCRDTNDNYFEFPDNGVQHFPVSYRIENSESDPYKRRIRFDDPFYYGKEVVLSSKRRFVHKRHVISSEDAEGICFDFGTKFMYCNNYANYLIFFNGRRLNNNQYRLVLPVRSTTPFFYFYIYLGVYFAEGDVLDIYYTPSPMRDVYIGQSREDGIVEVPKENLHYPLNTDSYIFWVNGYKIPKSKVKIIDSTRLQLTDDMKTMNRFAITEIVDELPDPWIIDNFQSIDSEWDRLMRTIDLESIHALLDIDGAWQTETVLEHQDLPTSTLMHELILRWYYQSTYVDTTKPFVYDYQEFDTDLSAIKEFDIDDNAILISTDGSRTDRSERATQSDRYMP